MNMADLLYHQSSGLSDQSISALRSLLSDLKPPFGKKDSVGVKLHWGEKGNRSFLPPAFAREITLWLRALGAKPFVFDTTVLYSGSRRTGVDSLKTADGHGYSEAYLGCPVVIADGLDGRNVVDIPAGYKHFESAQVAGIFDRVDGFFIFSHFKGHLASGFGGAIKNLSMGFASRAQKQRMHADVHPILTRNKCTRCGVCVEICPTGAAGIEGDEYPEYDLDLCIGCAQCIGLCPEVALEIIWETDNRIFQEKLVETAAAVWKRIKGRSVFVNAMLNITADCDCLPGRNPVIAPDAGFVGGYHPVAIDGESVRRVGAETFNKAHPHVDWRRQFSYSREIGFV